jgi:hypothetical protein
MVDITHHSPTIGSCRPTLAYAGEFMGSLKGYIPGLARHLGATPASLYERQRALIHGGLLDLPPGHGPGSGIRANVSSVAMLVLSVMASSRLNNSAERTQEIACARALDGNRCRFTGARTFLAAVETLIAQPERIYPADVSLLGLQVSHTRPRATILYRAGRDLSGPQVMTHDPKVEQMIEFGESIAREPPLWSMAILQIAVLDKIAQDLAAMAETSSRPVSST